jgi:branched-chain amino acid transport system permease protein
MPVRRTKLACFAVSGFIAGCAGSLYGGLSGVVDGYQFEPVSGLVILLFAFVGGITSVTGALIAGGLFALLAHAQAAVPELGGLVFLAIGAAAIGLGRQPNGLAGMLLEALRRLPRSHPVDLRVRSPRWVRGALRPAELGSDA